LTGINFSVGFTKEIHAHLGGHMPRGKFVVIAGPDGAGKSTLIASLSKLYPPQILSFTREPGGTPVSEVLRAELLSEDAKKFPPITQFLHFFCARGNLLERVVRPALLSGRHVLADRFDESTFAYQVVALRNRKLENVFWEIRKCLMTDEGMEPDLYIFIDVPVEIGMTRRLDAGKETRNHFDERPEAFHRRVHEGLNEFFTKVPHRDIDGKQSAEEVLADCLQILRPIFGEPLPPT